MSAYDMVVGILEKEEEWMESSDLVAKIIEKRGVSDRQAYRDIKGAWKNYRVRKIGLPDGAVLYGLPNWPFPEASLARPQKETLTFRDAFFYRCFKRIDEILKENIEGHGKKAMLKTLALIATLPPSMKTKLEPIVESAVESCRKNYAQDARGLVRIKYVSPEVDFLVGEISTLIHESL